MEEEGEGEMSRLRWGFGVAAVLSAMALSVPTAFAEFESSKSGGFAKMSENTFEGGGGTVICKEGNGKWALPAKSPSAVEKLWIQNWIGCKLKSKELKEVEAKVSECKLELNSPAKGVTSNAEVSATLLTACVVTAPKCQIKIAPEGNKQLKKGLAKNENNNLVLAAEYGGITDTLGETCAGISSTKVGKEKVTITAEGDSLAGYSYVLEEGYGPTNPSSPGVCHACNGDPVDSATGDLFETQTDLTVGGRGPGLHVTRTYNSLVAANASEPGPFGYGWAGPYTAHLVVNEKAETATVFQDGGSTTVFHGTGSTFNPGAWVQASLTKEGTSYIYTLPNQTKLVFNGSGQLTGETDRNGNTLTFAYNAKGQLKTATDGAERRLTFAYNSEGQVESVKDPMGHTVKYAYEGGNLISVTLPGEEKPRWKFAYNAAHELTSMTDGNGNTTKNEYDASKRVSAQTDALERKRTFKYAETKPATETKITEPNGSETIEQFNAAGLTTSMTRAAGTAIAATTTKEYDASLNLLAVTDPNKHTIRYTYSSTDDRTSEKDANGNLTKWEYDGTHDVKSTTAPKGETTTYKRDSHGNPELIERPAPGGGTQTTTYKYDAQGDVTEETNPLEETTKYGYDKYGDRESETDPAGDKRTFAYNEDSQETSEVSPRGNVEGAEASKFTTKTERDEQGRPTVVTNPLGHTTKYTYDPNGNRESVTDGNGHRTSYGYDADNEQIKTTRPDGTIAETGYDGEGRAISRIDGNKHTFKLVRNKLEEIVEETDPQGHTTARNYDLAGNQTKLTDPASRTTTYTYDPGNRLTEVSYSDGKTATVKYEYDADGKPVKMVDGTGETVYTYDQLERLTESKDGHHDTTAYEYDLANEQTKLTYPNSEMVTRAYDKVGRLEKITDWLGNTTKFSYDPNSAVTATTFPSGTGAEDKYTYDEAGQMSEVKMSNSKATLATLLYTRDNEGQVKRTTSKGLPGGEKLEYVYDSNNRLTEGAGIPYEYDLANNPKKIGAETYTYTSADEIEKATNTTYAYNEDGQRTETTPTGGPTTKYGYDQAGNLILVERPEQGKVVKINDTYAYDGHDLRASQTISGATTYMTWNTAERLPLVLNDGTNSYIYGPGGLPIEQINGENKPLYLHHDQQGSTRMLTGPSGEDEGAFTYDPYGNTTSTSGAAGSPLGYDAQYTSADTGLIYLRARTYDPQTAQFLSLDPDKAETGAPYNYAADNPANVSDPSGNQGRGVQIPRVGARGGGDDEFGPGGLFGPRPSPVLGLIYNNTPLGGLTVVLTQTFTSWELIVPTPLGPAVGQAFQSASGIITQWVVPTLLGPATQTVISTPGFYSSEIVIPVVGGVLTNSTLLSSSISCYTTVFLPGG